MIDDDFNTLSEDICDCDFDSQTAYLVKKINDKPINTITIVEYLNDKNTQKKINKEKLYLVCKKGNKLIKYKSEKRKPHFKHKNIGDNAMSLWHKEWQECFEETERVIGKRRADAIVGNKILEFQYSRITTENIDNRTENYKNYKVLWIIDCRNNIEIEENGKTYILTFVKDQWKYKNFINQKYIYLDTGNRIFRIRPSNVKSNIIEVSNYKVKNEFIEYLYNDTIEWEDCLLEQGVIYFNQRGAGCGKTYESIQLIQNDKFANKELFIYLTKVHPAKDVIFSEFKDQVKNDNLHNIIINKNLDELKDEKDRKYIIPGTRLVYKDTTKEIKKEFEMIIATIDSFTFAVGKEDFWNSDFFKGINKSIIDEQMKIGPKGKINYAKKNVNLNKKCLVIIDEAQDLGPDYIEAFDVIVKKTGIDVYVIGDKLQSIWDDINIYTYIENNELDTPVHKSEGKNEVRRFHNIQFKDFVNKIIDFKKYNLPQIEDICNKKCEYKHQDDEKPYEIFQIPTIYNRDYDYKKVNDTIEKIINRIENEINAHQYIPKNFMFIFPFLKGNYLVGQLEERLQEFWIKKLKDKNYQKIILSQAKKNSEHEYNHWKNHIDTIVAHEHANKYKEYVYLHKSEDKQPINLVESEYATRMLSIHSSKGNGCEVVFLLGISEYTLCRYSKQKCNLVYDSLLHVAITRQKMSLYIGIDNKSGEIWNRFNNNFQINMDPNIKPSPEFISTRIKISDICESVINNDEIYKHLYHSIILPNNCENKLPPNRKNEDHIKDWGHHIIRYAMFFYNLMKKIIENESMQEDDYEKSQFYTKLKKISKKEIKCCAYAEYRKELVNITSSNIHRCAEYNKKLRNIPSSKSNIVTQIPILLLETADKSIYRKYCNILKEFMKDIQKKIKQCLNNKKLPELCSLETVILLYMMNVMDDGIYIEKPRILDIYSIMYYYDESSNEINKDHPKECLCKKFFTEGNNIENTNKYVEIRKSICKHYEKINQVNTIYNNYHKYISKKYKQTKFIYNIKKVVSFRNNKINFNLYKRYQILAYSDEYVINFIIKPQFDKLNFSEIMVDIILDHFILKYCDDKRYQNKKISTCIFTLDPSNEPIFYDHDIEKIYDDLCLYIKNFLIEKYEKFHIILYDYYNYCLKNKPKDTNSIDYMYNELETYRRSKIQGLPEYMYDYFKTVKEKINKKKKINQPFNKNLESVQNKEIFLDTIKNKLIDIIDEYLKINNNINNDY